jgi:hypothetical protein
MHSELPWHIEYNHEVDVLVIYSGNKKVCYMSNFHQSGVGHAERFKNAELICAAVNKELTQRRPGSIDVTGHRPRTNP